MLRRQVEPCRQGFAEKGKKTRPYLPEGFDDGAPTAVPAKRVADDRPALVNYPARDAASRQVGLVMTVEAGR